MCKSTFIGRVVNHGVVHDGKGAPLRQQWGAGWWVSCWWSSHSGSCYSALRILLNLVVGMCSFHGK